MPKCRCTVILLNKTDVSNFTEISRTGSHEDHAIKRPVELSKEKRAIEDRRCRPHPEISGAAAPPDRS